MVFSAALAAGWAGLSAAATYYVRGDGGSASQCSGLADAPYPGGGGNQPCAWNHPFWALPPGGAQAPRISGGDTLVIGPGSYRMGYGAPNTGDCSADGSFDCTMAPVPSGPSPSQSTRILGRGWDQGCPNPPELWGSERPWQIVDLTGTDNAILACLEVTDHSPCIEFHSGGLACQREDPPYGDWATAGIYAEDSSNVTLQDLDVHGLAETGIHAARLTDWTVENVRIAHNGWAGWDGDIPGGDSNSGTLLFRHLTIEWNGCSETYPSGATAGCWAQTAGGYGDGLGTGFTLGHWVFEDSSFLHNTSDGLDLLYMEPAATVEVRRTRAEGNAGNQIKVGSTATIENSVVVGNCGFFEGQPFTYDVDNCRAVGNALSIDLRAGTQSSIANSTIYSEGDCALLIGNGGCNGSETLRSRNNIFIGGTDFLQPFENTCFAYNDGCPGDPLDQDYGIIYNVKENPCPLGGHDLCTNPLVVSGSGSAFDARLTAASPAIDSGLAVGGIIPADDFLGASRPAGAGVDRGAYEYGAGSPPTSSADFFLTVIPEGVGPGGAVTIAAGLADTPTASPPYTVVISPGNQTLDLEPREFELLTQSISGSTAITLDSTNPAGIHLEADVAYTPNQPYSVGIAALPATNASRGRGTPILHAGDPLTVLIAVAGDGSQLGDLYAAVVLPSGAFYCFSGAVNTLGPANTILPLASGVPIANSSLTAISLPSLPAGLPRGNYLLLAAIGPAGGNILTDSQSVASSAFRFE